MAKIKWSHDSIEDLKEICRFIAIDSPYYANLLNDRIFEMVEHLELFPEMGRHIPKSDDPTVRELLYKSYRIIYQIKEGYLEIITVIHGKCGLTPEMAVRIAKATNTSPESWLAMQTKLDLWQAMQDEPKDVIKFEPSIAVQ